MGENFGGQSLILEKCSGVALEVVVLRGAAPLEVEIDAVVVQVPSHVVPVHTRCRRQWRRHLHARSLVLDPEYLLHRVLALRLDNLSRLARRSNAHKRESAVRHACPGSPRVFVILTGCQ